jgi:hypothetical protein
MTRARDGGTACAWQSVMCICISASDMRLRIIQGTTMKYFLVASAMLVSVFSAATSAQAQARQDFTLINRTGYDISEVYISPEHTNDWEEDVLGHKDLLENGERREITFHRVGRTCIWDLKVVYHDDDSSAVWHDINLCKVSKITIRYNRKSDTTSASFD